MAKPESNKGIQGRLNALGYSIAGLKGAWGEPSFRTEVLVAPFFFLAIFFVTPHATQRAILIATVFSILALELVNSAIEAAIDRHGDEIHPLSKLSKDTASAAILIAIINLVCIWTIIIADNWQSYFPAG